MSRTHPNTNTKHALDRLSQRLHSEPDRPIPRTPERPANTSIPAPTAAKYPTTTTHQPTTTTHQPTATADHPSIHSPTPEWSRLLPLPRNLDPVFRRWLFRYIEATYNPTNPHEDLLAAQIAQALARKHLSAQREPEETTSLWLRYENLADRQLRQAQRAWHDHQKSKPENPLERGSSPPRSATAPPATHHNHPPVAPPPTPSTQTLHSQIHSPGSRCLEPTPPTPDPDIQTLQPDTQNLESTPTPTSSTPHNPTFLHSAAPSTQATPTRTRHTPPHASPPPTSEHLAPLNRT